MAAKVLYTKAGNDPSPTNWPLPGNGYSVDEFFVTTGVVATFPGIIAYPAPGLMTYPDGRQIPGNSTAGSTFVLVFP